MSAAPADQRRVGLCFLDLDEFKAVNEDLGHDVGDQLLIAFASRLVSCCGPGQLVARMGGDEFVIIVENSCEEEIVALAEEILAALAAPILLGDHELTVTATIGIVERPVADTNPADLIRSVDIALYRAKADGKARYVMFDVSTESIESPAQLERFPAMVCDAGQGLLFGLPGTPEQIDALLQAATGLLCELSANVS